MADQETDELRKRSSEVLTIPAQSAPPPDSFLLNPKEVRRWAEELPVANIGETARQVYNTLVTFNRIRIPTLVRTEIIETFREPVRYVNHNISRHYFNVGFPLSSRAQKAAQLTGALCDEVANAYKILFLDQILGDERSFNQKLVIVAAQRAILYLGEKMFHNLLVYRDYPANAWREANYLYAWAAQNQVEEVAVKENRGFLRSKKNARSIGNVYKSMLLLATTNPYRLRQSQIRQLREKALHWADLARLQPAHETKGNTGLFFVNLWEDAPPRPTLSEEERRDARFFALDVNPVIDEARAEFEISEWESPAHLSQDHTHLSKTLLRPLIRQWTKSLERKFPRDNTRNEIEAIVGLSHLLRLLEERRKAEAEQHAPPPEPVEKTISPASRLTWNDSVFSSLAINSPAHSLSGDSLFADSKTVISTLLGTSEAERFSPKRNASHQESPFAALSYNESVEGYCLSWRKSYPMRVRVGDILGVRSPDKSDDFGVAVVRWLRQHSDRELYLGIQILAPSCATVTVMPSRKPGSNQEGYRCLLLSNNDEEEYEQSLLTNTHVFKAGSQVTLITEFGRHQIELTHWIESTNNFVHYRFKYIDSDRKDGKNGAGKPEFDDIWNEL